MFLVFQLPCTYGDLSGTLVSALQYLQGTTQLCPVTFHLLSAWWVGKSECPLPWGSLSSAAALATPPAPSSSSPYQNAVS